MKEPGYINQGITYIKSTEEAQRVRQFLQVCWGLPNRETGQEAEPLNISEGPKNRAIYLHEERENGYVKL